MLFHDWKKAVWKAPLHVLMSIPFAAASIVVPPAGKAYVNWRGRAERRDNLTGKDSPEKAAVDYYTQTALVKGVLKIYGIHPNPTNGYFD